jgi:hypothetical protein
VSSTSAASAIGATATEEQQVTRVVVWSTGGIGSLAIVAVQERPDLDLVGVWVHSEAKVGRDAGKLANGTPIGVLATNDFDALLALEPDCVVYAASGPERDAGAVADYERLLAAGVNVVTTTSTNLINPPTYPLAHRERLEAAAKTGGASIYASGIEPGFVCDQLPLVLATASRSITKVHCYEIALYDDYGVEEIMVDALGFGRPLDSDPWINLPGAIAGEFAGQVGLIADGLGVDVDEVREWTDGRCVDEGVDPAEATGGLLDRRPGRRLVGDVARDRECAGAGLLGGGVEARFAPCEKRDPGAALREDFRDARHAGSADADEVRPVHRGWDGGCHGASP